MGKRKEMISKKILLVLMLLVSSSSSFAQQNDHEQKAGHGTADNAVQHSGGAMGRGGKNGHGGQDGSEEKGHGNMSMKMQEGEGHGGMSMNVSHGRHHFARDNGIAESYKGMENPLVESDIDANRAQSLYQDNCAECHGEQGIGDGAAGAGLDPAPTDIARFAKMKMAKDHYLLWTIAEGGEPVASDMPAFKDVLSSDEMWQIVAYLRQLSK